jgi:hypothetical protein
MSLYRYIVSDLEELKSLLVRGPANHLAVDSHNRIADVDVSAQYVNSALFSL